MIRGHALPTLSMPMYAYIHQTQTQHRHACMHTQHTYIYRVNINKLIPRIIDRLVTSHD